MSSKRMLRSNFIMPRCTEACPVQVDVPRYIRAIRENKYDEAVAVLREKLPFPTVCADACFAPCEDVCAYKQFGDPIAIRALKRAAVDKGSDGWKQKKRLADKTGKKAAIVGAGPAGLSAAYYLAGKGHEITVFDSFPKPGGMMRYGIPGYRLPEERLDRDIKDILGKDITLDQLKDDYDAVFIASGANDSAKIALQGADKKGVFWGLDFLREVGQGKSFDLEGDVIVVGGGNVAIDAALTAKRMGAAGVHLFCLENREEMPAHKWEIERAEEEGVLIHNSWGPKKVFGDEAASGIGLIKCTSVFDEQGKFNPSFDEEITYKQAANHIILAVGQTVNLEFIQESENIKTSQTGIEVDGEALSSGESGVFAGGDVVSGPGSIIAAIAHGRKAAASIDEYLGGDGDINEILAAPEDEVLLPEFIGEVKPRNNMAVLPPWKRVSGFDQVELALTDEQTADEASRCLSCDARRFEVILNMEYCKECGYCAE
ncbi:MAG: FAD-dependent oxidoreductase, partial [Deltaproteobacteria bacterium]|nr:FAD-dependent oxidoreductase [Deltaproteobacteria bacterium]